MGNDRPSSLELLQRAQQKNAEASQELLVRFREPLLNRIRLMMGNEVRRIAESNDFLQEVMVDFLEESKSFDTRSEGDILRWMTAVARNNIRDAGRRLHARAFDKMSYSFSGETIETPNPTPGSLVARHEEAILLAEGIEKLKDEYRRVIELHHFEGLGLKEVAERFGRSYEAVKKLHTRAMVRLGLILSPNG